ncbi:MAG: aminotransferase class V-fold PLP-dependent enzyme [Caulobacteraceae bacterium]
MQLENGQFGAMSRPVLAAFEEKTRMVNRQTTIYTRGPDFAEDSAKVRAKVAAMLGVGADEIVFSRGTTESMQTLIGGYNKLRPGDAVLYADLDYDSMQTSMEGLHRTRGVKIVKIDLPEPATRQGLIDAYAAALRPIRGAHDAAHPSQPPHRRDPAGARDRRHGARQRCGRDPRRRPMPWDRPTSGSKTLASISPGSTCTNGSAPRSAAGWSTSGRTVSPTSTSPCPRRRATRSTRACTPGRSTMRCDPDRGRCGRFPEPARARRQGAAPAPPARSLGRKRPRPSQGAGADAQRSRHARRPDLIPHQGIVTEADNVILRQTLLTRYKILTVERAGPAMGACIRVTPSFVNGPEDVQRLVAAIGELTA